MARRRRCKASTKAGRRCRAAPLRGGTYCSAHDPNRPDETRFGSREQASRAGAAAKPRTPAVSEVLRERVEGAADEILAPYFKALGVEYVNGEIQRGPGAVHVGKTKDGDVIASDVEDLAGQITAAERLLDRVYGKPKQTAELSGPDGGPIVVDESLDLSKLDDAQLKQLQELIQGAAATHR